MRGPNLDVVVKIPKQTGVIINWSDKNKVIYSQGSKRDAKGNPTRIGGRVIGYAINATEMNPNSNFELYFPNEYELATGKKPEADIKRFGLKLIISTICEKNGVCSTLMGSIDDEIRHALLDFSAYCLLNRDGVIEHYQQTMEDQILFSGELHNKDYYYDLFKKRIPEKNTIAFRRLWAEECIKQGDTEVWLCIDGSNDDCECTGVEFVEKGYAKSHKNTTIVGFSYAVTERGKPVTYEFYRGGLVDSKALKLLIESVESYGFHVKGVIIDRAYCYYNIVEYLREKHIAFILMLKRNVPAYATILEKFGNMLRLLPGENWIEGTNLYGANAKYKLYKGSKVEDTVCLYFDPENASSRVGTLLRSINKALKSIREAIQKDKPLPAIDSKVAAYLEYVYTEEKDSDNSLDRSGQEPTEQQSSSTEENKSSTSSETPIQSNDNSNTSADNEQKKTASERMPTGVKVRRELLQKSTDDKGFFAIACSESLSAFETYEHYSNRDASETCYMILKSQEGYKEVRLHFPNGIKAKFFAGFISSIIRYYLKEACGVIDQPSNEIIRKSNMIRMRRSKDVFIYSDETDENLKKFLKAINVDSNWSRDYVKEENDKLLGIEPVHRKRKPGPNPGSHHRTYDENGNVVKKKPGPKPGSHHKKKYNKDGSLRKKPGPKPGQKNEKKSTPTANDN